MKPLDITKKIAQRACVYNTVAVLVLYSLGRLLPNGVSLIPKLENLLLILLFSFALSTVNHFIRLTKSRLPLKLAIHYVTVAVVFYVIFIVWGKFAKNASFILVFMTVFTALYALIAFASIGIGSLKRKSTTDSEEEKYESQFSGDN